MRVLRTGERLLRARCRPTRSRAPASRRSRPTQARARPWGTVRCRRHSRGTPRSRPSPCDRPSSEIASKAQLSTQAPQPVQATGLDSGDVSGACKRAEPRPHRLEPDAAAAAAVAHRVHAPGGGVLEPQRVDVASLGSRLDHFESLLGGDATRSGLLLGDERGDGVADVEAALERSAGVGPRPVVLGDVAAGAARKRDGRWCLEHDVARDVEGDDGLKLAVVDRLVDA